MVGLVSWMCTAHPSGVGVLSLFNTHCVTPPRSSLVVFPRVPSGYMGPILPIHYPSSCGVPLPDYLLYISPWDMTCHHMEMMGEDVGYPGWDPIWTHFGTLFGPLFDPFFHPISCPSHTQSPTSHGVGYPLVFPLGYSSPLPMCIPSHVMEWR